MNRYVLDGVGDPKRLLSGLYFWTWNTQEVLDLVAWMRQWNAGAPGARVQFLGFDMQFPGAAMDTVGAFFARLDSANASFVSQRYQCLVAYRNFGAAFGRPMSGYAALPESDRSACRAGLQAVFDLITGARAAYETASSPAVYANAQHSARLVEQWETMAAASASTYAGSLARDRSMAENTAWLLDQAGPNARMMLWAHNYHVSRVAGAMGGHLDSAFGDDYVNLAFLFGRGGFNAVQSDGTTNLGLTALQAQLVPGNSVEAVFLGAGQARLLLDARRITQGGDAAAPLRGPIPMRSIGAVFNPAQESAYFAAQLLPEDFDLLMFFDAATPSTLLPFITSSQATTLQPGPPPLP